MSESLQTRVLVALRDLILKGKFSPGERLAEVALAEMLNVSRTPVRVALATLEREGLVEPNATGGFVMRGVTPKEIEDSITIRGRLEGMAARMAAEQGVSRSLLAQLRECLAVGDELLSPQPSTSLDEYTVYTDMNDRFHSLLIQAARSEMLTRTVEYVNLMPFSAPSALVSGPIANLNWLVIAHHQHHAIVDAIEKGQGTRAQAICEEHINIALSNLQAILEQPEIAEALIPGIKLRKRASDNDAILTKLRARSSSAIG